MLHIIILVAESRNCGKIATFGENGGFVLPKRRTVSPFSMVAMSRIPELGFELIEYPSYLLGLALSDIFLFDRLKVGGQRF